MPRSNSSASGVISKEETEGLAGQHRLVDRRDLVREGVHEGGVDRQHGVEEMGQADPVCLGHEPEEGAVPVETPREPYFNNFKPRLVVPVEDLVRDPAVGPAVDQSQSVGAVPLHANYCCERIGQDTADGGVGAEIFKSHELSYLLRLVFECSVPFTTRAPLLKSYTSRLTAPA